MKFGIFDQNDRSGQPLAQQYEERLQLAELFDANGFHCYHTSEHHATPLSTTPSQNVLMSAIAQRTKNLRLCPLVYLLPIHHPVRLAEEICMLDHLSNGRFEFGIGRGASPHELAAMGVDVATTYRSRSNRSRRRIRRFGTRSRRRIRLCGPLRAASTSCAAARSIVSAR